MPLAFLYSDELKEYDFGPGHPFRGDRFQNFLPYLKKQLPPENNYVLLTAGEATDEDLLRICREDYIEFTRKYYAAAHVGRDYDDDFYLFQSGDNMPIGRPGNVEMAARVVVGQAKKAADLVMTGKYQKVVSIGGGLHHAKSAYGEGFCLYNDVAFCAKYAQEVYKLDRVLVLDSDAHAGNGTADYLFRSPNFLFIDIHQDPMTIYPGTGFAEDIGDGDGKGFKMNIPMPVYAGNRSYALAFDELIMPVVAEFKPQLIIRNGGSDPYFEDGLTRLGLTAAGFRMMGDHVRQMSEICGGKQIDLIASGYNPDVLPQIWFALLSGIAPFDVPVVEPRPIPARLQADFAYETSKTVVEQVKNHLRPYWKCFQ